MVLNSSVPLIGLQQASWDLEKIAQRIASQGQTGRSNEENGAAALGLDPAANMAMMAQVENTAKANMRVISTHDELSKSMLDLFA